MQNIRELIATLDNEFCAEQLKEFMANPGTYQAPWAFDIEELVKRNSHGVPRDTIIDMLQKYEAPDVFKRKLGLK